MLSQPLGCTGYLQGSDTEGCQPWPRPPGFIHTHTHTHTHTHMGVCNGLFNPFPLHPCPCSTPALAPSFLSRNHQLQTVPLLREVVKPRGGKELGLPTSGQLLTSSGYDYQISTLLESRTLFLCAMYFLSFFF